MGGRQRAGLPLGHPGGYACLPWPPARPETAPAARGPGRGIRLGEGKHGLAPSSALWHFSAYTCTESLEADRAHHKSIRPWRRLSRRPATAIADVAASALVPRMDAVVVRLGGEPNSRAQLAKRRPWQPAFGGLFPVVAGGGHRRSHRRRSHALAAQEVATGSVWASGAPYVPELATSSLFNF